MVLGQPPLFPYGNSIPILCLHYIVHHTERFYPLFHLITEWVTYEAEQNYRWGNDSQDLKFRNKPNLSQVMEHTKCILKANSTVLTWPTLPYISRILPETITRNLALLFWNSAAISHIQSYSSSRCSETCPSIMPLNQRAMHLSFLKFHNAVPILTQPPLGFQPLFALRVTLRNEGYSCKVPMLWNQAAGFQSLVCHLLHD